MFRTLRSDFNAFSFFSYVSSLVFVYIYLGFTIHSYPLWISLIAIQVISSIYVLYFMKYKIHKSSRFSCELIKITNKELMSTHNLKYIELNILICLSLYLNLALGILIIIYIGYLYIKLNLCYINPLYTLFNIYIYKISLVCLDLNEKYELYSKDSILISNGHLHVWEHSRFYEIDYDDRSFIRKRVN